MNFVLQVSNCGINKSEGGVLFENINFNVSKSSCLGIIGKNGSGKTTLLEAIAGLRRISNGSINLFGKKINQDYSLLEKFGYMPQDYNFNQFDTPLNILETQLALFGFNRDIGKIHEILKQVSLEDNINTVVLEMSGGMKRRLMVARALITDPSLVILDEPTAGVDVITRKKIWDYVTFLIEEKQTSFLLVTHIVQELDALCSEVISFTGKTTSEPISAKLIKEECFKNRAYILYFDKMPCDLYKKIKLIKKQYPLAKYNKLKNTLMISSPENNNVKNIILQVTTVFEDVDIIDIFREPYSLSNFFK